MNAIAIIAAGGSGQRFGSTTPKQFLNINGVPVIVHTLRAFQEAPSIQSIIIAAPKDHLSLLSPDFFALHELKKPIDVVCGGKTRQESVLRGLRWIKSSPEYVVIHDAARCLISAHLLEDTLRACRGWDGAISALPVRDTIKKITGERITETIPRENLWAMQTPQVFEFEKIRNAYERAVRENYSATDDAAVAEFDGARVRVVEGSTENIKVTSPNDLQIAENLLHARHK